MAKFTSIPAPQNISVGGQYFRKNKNGAYKIPYKLIRLEDLSLVPPGTLISIKYSKIDGELPDEPINISGVKILNQSRLLVFAQYYQCPCCWKHALSFNKFTTAVIDIFKQEESTNASFSAKGVILNTKDEPIHCVAIEVANGSFNGIETLINDALMKVLKPLHDALDALDAQVLQKLGV